MESIATLDTKTTNFFDQLDPEMVKWLGNSKADLWISALIEKSNEDEKNNYNPIFNNDVHDNK